MNRIWVTLDNLRMLIHDYVSPELSKEDCNAIALAYLLNDGEGYLDFFTFLNHIEVDENNNWGIVDEKS